MSNQELCHPRSHRIHSVVSSVCLSPRTSQHATRDAARQAKRRSNVGLVGNTRPALILDRIIKRPLLQSNPGRMAGSIGSAPYVPSLLFEAKPSPRSSGSRRQKEPSSSARSSTQPTHLDELRVDREGPGRRQVRQHRLHGGGGVVLARNHHAVAPLP